MNLTRIHLEIFCGNWISAEFVQDILTNISLRWYHQSGVHVKEGMGRISLLLLTSILQLHWMATPYELFSQFFTDEVWNLLVQYTNCYDAENGPNTLHAHPWEDMPVPEMKAFVGIPILMGTVLVKLPQLEIYGQVKHPQIATKRVWTTFASSPFIATGPCRSTRPWQAFQSKQSTLFSATQVWIRVCNARIYNYRRSNEPFQTTSWLFLSTLHRAESSTPVTVKRTNQDGSRNDVLCPPLLPEVYDATIRNSQCEIIISGAKCEKCVSYQDYLRKAYHRWIKTKQTSPSRCTSSTCKTNFRYLDTPEKEQRYKKLKRRSREIERKLRDTIEWANSREWCIHGAGYAKWSWEYNGREDCRNSKHVSRKLPSAHFLGAATKCFANKRQAPDTLAPSNHYMVSSSKI